LTIGTVLVLKCRGIYSVVHNSWLLHYRSNW